MNAPERLYLDTEAIHPAGKRKVSIYRTSDTDIEYVLDKDLIVWNEDNTYKCIKESSVKCYEYISKEYEFMAHDRKTNLHDFVLKVIIKFINEKLMNNSSISQKGE